MNNTADDKWMRFQRQYTWFKSIGLGLDFSRSTMPEDYADQMRRATDRAFVEMRELEAGAIANADEGRMVGHYWLRNPAQAPSQDIRKGIEDTIASIKRFSREIHNGSILGHSGHFTHLLLIGIGGSALGPQFVSHALSHPSRDKMTIRFMDNTDPDGFERVLAGLSGVLGRTLCLVISKSGGTKETRNAMLEVEAAYADAHIPFARHAVAITGDPSELANHARSSQWLKIFPMWDWVGGRTSELSAVGLLPCALQGFDIDLLLEGARQADEVTANENVGENPAIQLALFVYYIGNGSGCKSMVVLPYKDCLELFSRYLQQLIMESLGKGTDRRGRKISQGLTVFGNKGSTDQHAYVQQLREGLPNFFGLFIEVLEEQRSKFFEVEPHISSGDYLTGFLLGTRDALFENGRESVLLTLRRVDEFHVGVLIALFERFTGFYASMIDVNAYHQPGVEAGKKAATDILRVQVAVINWLSAHPNKYFNVVELASAVAAGDSTVVFKICEHLAANRRISSRNPEDPKDAAFSSL